METTLAKLIAKETDTGNYTTYVFKIINKTEVLRIGSKYIMCVRFPNWEHREIFLGERGYLSYEVIRAGVDRWFDGKNLIPYRYNMVQFVKFIQKPKTLKREIIM